MARPELLEQVSGAGVTLLAQQGADGSAVKGVKHLAIHLVHCFLAADEGHRYRIRGEVRFLEYGPPIVLVQHIRQLSWLVAGKVENAASHAPPDVTPAVRAM